MTIFPKTERNFLKLRLFFAETENFFLKLRFQNAKTQNKKSFSAYKIYTINAILSANERSVLCYPEYWETPKSKIFI